MPSPARTAHVPAAEPRLRVAGAVTPSRDERAFLPAALAVLETPPNPLGRRLLLAIVLTAFAALAWASIGEVDIVAVASGKMVSHTRTVVIQPFETGSIEAVLVRDGQAVAAGDALVELDKTAARAERDRAANDGIAAQLDELRFTAFLDGATTAPFETVATASEQERARAQAQLSAQNAAVAGQLAAIAAEREQRVADRLSPQLTEVKLRQTLPLVDQRAEIKRASAAMGNSSIPAKLESQQLAIETRAELDITLSKILALDAAIRGLDQKRTTTIADARLNAMNERAKAVDRARAASEALVKATRRLDLLTLRAPIAGTVQQVHPTNVGNVVTPAQQLLSIVPSSNGIEVEAVLENRDVGFVVVGQPVELKIDAYPFTRYGLMRGTVTAVDRDAEASPVDAKVVNGSQRTADATDYVEASERLRYTVRIALTTDGFEVDGRPAVLLPGMAVKAEVITGRRKIIDYLLSPLREVAHDAMRER
ncbi:HlyD family type I secretion periplasmic adaptor subunit [Siculibacillus lacustris]|uniref:Membrane fusion protein (MFP) family protein n=1 Tax=Siculibacillus lacustris TaxID=1549641 RepID=A0A4Q9VCH6_9HYPH|nr:HlyD family type I secretion periplasmic adaptor subunit [Siculibacillus lacustris]TBW32231.1 HlyD family type I secretion periplasmic adaptor subunit [Siculibacillus lacustris]